MRNLILWSLCLALSPWLVFGQTSHWDSTMIAAQKAYGQAQYREAELQLMQAEKEAESFGPFDRRLAKSLNNLAQLYVREARYGEAEPVLKRALGICEKDGDSAATEKASTLNNLAALYAYQS